MGTAGISFASDSTAFTANIDEFVETHPYPCPGIKAKGEVDACILGAIIGFMEKGEKETSKKLDVFSFDILTRNVALYGTTAQKEKLLAEFDKHGKNINDVEETPHATSYERMKAEAQSGKIILLLSLNRMDDAVRTIQDISDAKVALLRECSPQMDGLKFLIDASRLDDAVSFFRKTEHIFFAQPHVYFHSGIRLTYTPSTLIGALLAQDRYDDALLLKNSIDEKGIYFGFMKADNYEKYFSVYQEYKNSKDKKAFANHYLTPYHSYADELEKRKTVKEKIVKTLSESNSDAFDNAFSELRESFKSNNNNDVLISEIMLPQIGEIENEKAQNFLWGYFIKNHARYNPLPALSNLELAQDVLRHYFNFYEDNFSIDHFLQDKTLDELRKN